MQKKYLRCAVDLTVEMRDYNKREKGNSMIQKFTCHEEIDTMTASYILSVADANSIWQIPIEDINSFLEGLDDYIDDDDGQPDWAQEWADFGESYE